MSDPLAELQRQMRECRLCEEAGHAVTVGAVFTGQATAQLMTIGQAPGVTEVTAKRPFNAGSGQRLFQWLGAAGWDETAFRAEQYMTSVTKCYPRKQKSGRGDRVPSKEEQQLCRPYLEQEIALVQPRLIIPIGNLAISLFFPDKPPLNQLIGRAVYLPPSPFSDPFDLSAGIVIRHLVPDQKEGRYIVPLPHPSGASLWPNHPTNQALLMEAIGLLREIRDYWEL